VRDYHFLENLKGGLRGSTSESKTVKCDNRWGRKIAGGVSLQEGFQQLYEEKLLGGVGGPNAVHN